MLLSFSSDSRSGSSTPVATNIVNTSLSNENTDNADNNNNTIDGFRDKFLETAYHFLTCIKFEPDINEEYQNFSETNKASRILTADAIIKKSLYQSMKRMDEDKRDGIEENKANKRQDKKKPFIYASKQVFLMRFYHLGKHNMHYIHWRI